MGIRSIIACVAILSSIITQSGVGMAHPGTQNVIRHTVRVIRTIPHNPQSFTQGLLYYNGMLYESTGLYGQSSLQRIDAATGRVEKVLPLPDIFGEGLVRWENRLIQLTWQQGVAYIYNLDDFAPIGTFSYKTEGWGLTTDGRYLIMSDGTNTLYFRDPYSFQTVRTLPVTLQGQSLPHLNELEYIDGQIYANIWYAPYIVQIDPADGTVVGVLDARPLFRMQPPLSQDSVLNGIAYNDDAKTFYLTGKNWPYIFEVTIETDF